MQITKCPSPWFEMDIGFDQQVRCCCYYTSEISYWDFKKPFDMREQWNNEGMRKVREIVTSGKLDRTGCDGCFFVKYNDFNSFYSVPEQELNATQKENYLRACDEFQNGKVSINSYPVRYMLYFGLACNLRCIMCCQKIQRQHEKREVPVEAALQLKEYFKYANEISIIGGEPFFMNNSRKFIDAVVTDPSLSNVKLAIFSNGMLMHHFLEKLKPIRRLNICVSLDATGPLFEFIRRGSRWQQVEKNILAFKKVAGKENLNWQVTIATIIMKSSLKHLNKLVDWVIENDTPCHFTRLSDQWFTFNEDIFRNPRLLRSIPDWKGILDEAIIKFNKKGWHASANSLGLMKQELEDSCSKWSFRQYLFAKGKKACSRLLPCRILQKVFSIRDK